MSLTSSNQIVEQSWNYSMLPVIQRIFLLGVGTPIVTSNTLRQISFVFAYGTLINSSSSFTNASSGVPNAIILGFSLAGTTRCVAASVVKEQFYKMVDELRVYSRELNASDVYALANP